MRAIKLPVSGAQQGSVQGAFDVKYKGEGVKPKVARVPIDKVRATQEEVRVSKDRKLANFGGQHEYPELPRLPSGIRDPKTKEVHLWDGHHRAEAAKLKGQKTLRVNVVDDPDIDKY